MWDKEEIGVTDGNQIHDHLDTERVLYPLSYKNSQTFSFVLHLCHDVDQFTFHYQQGSYPYSETDFQDFSRTQIDFSRPLKFTLAPTRPRSQCYILVTAFHTLHIFLGEFNRFPELSRTSDLFPGLSSPGKCHNKIPGLSRFSRTRTNPVSGL